MARNSIVFLVVSSFLVSSFSRNEPYGSKILNVAGSVQKTRFALSPRREIDLEDKRSKGWGSSFAVTVRPRLRHARSFVDYESFTAARLELDRSRVRSMHALLGLEARVTSGLSLGMGEYLCRLGVGNPPVEMEMVMDTGSDLTWLQSEPCEHCYPQATPIFRPRNSSTYLRLSCGSHQCKSLDFATYREPWCGYDVTYGDLSFSVGELVTETLTLGRTKIDNVTIGLGHVTDGLFNGLAGILGLGGGASSLPRQLNGMSFSYCLVGLDSNSSSLLVFNSSLPRPHITARLLRKPNPYDTFYFLDLAYLNVSGFRVNLSTSEPADVLIDSGTTITRFPTAVYEAVRGHFVKGMRHFNAKGAFSIFDTCYDLLDHEKVTVPALSFFFSNGQSLDLPAKNCLIPINDKGTFCFAFAPSDSEVTIIGNFQQQGIRVGYDLRNSVVGFSPNSC